ncbi:MAG TPA: hypothetical protein VFL62_21290 [Bradyrhizobium sp.]|uniref:hypothetical protein n=1 Tax=Bradyrhizobium sp. TaxID=376 RepID=UPI002D808C45|nr:hypothetical protein [Bradyrhizobium sp.]HET7888766.1 hypothetical protein [Bradyrhizobium sp.]
MPVYVSVTGFRPNGWLSLPAFWWRTLRSLNQARTAPGIVQVEARIIDGNYHTMTVWNDKASMHRFVTSGAHRNAMKNFRSLGSGKTYGFVVDQVPDWSLAYSLWRQHGRKV